METTKRVFDNKATPVFSEEDVKDIIHISEVNYMDCQQAREEGLSSQVQERKMKSWERAISLFLTQTVGFKSEQEVRKEAGGKGYAQGVHDTKLKEKEAIASWLEDRNSPLFRYVYDCRKNMDATQNIKEGSQEYGYRLANNELYTFYAQVAAKLRKEK